MYRVEGWYFFTDIGLENDIFFADIQAKENSKICLALIKRQLSEFACLISSYRTSYIFKLMEFLHISSDNTSLPFVLIKLIH